MSARRTRWRRNCRSLLTPAPACSRSELPISRKRQARSCSSKRSCRVSRIEPNRIATPTFLHATMTRQAALAGKHVHCEKPFCRSVAEGMCKR
ncbi:MAG: hypothetical protein F4X14_11155 [Caldilineaceae bacterium SB0661_bin_32]|uniref:Gfo/Idh/MocA-like oxidoreductase N-terminal domain-containing protein n=1 Tax=Caldilineaceae bacterium SB0661_bin_32 TaxID=2605255 RepID=A0A6B1D7D8_9CHLR|nr:hypothetical protein [Caldilineaceae bacterium SB0661_bin_32]